MMTLVMLAAAVMLAPFVLYLVGFIRDPFHPLIFMGVVSYFIVPDRLIFNRQANLDLLEESFFNPFLVASILSMLGIYVGWYLGGKRRRAFSEMPPAPSYDPFKMGVCALAFAVVGGISHYQYGNLDYNPEVSGYLRDLNRLWIAGAILSVQALFLTPRGHRFPLYMVLAIALYPPADRFLAYGQRGDTFRVALLIMMGYMILGKRPSKPVFLTGALCLGTLLATLALTRSLVLGGEASNRFQALTMVIPEFFKERHTLANPADEQIFGSAVVNTVRATETYGRGLSITVGMVGRFLPRALFPNKDQYTHFSGAMTFQGIRAETGLVIPFGAAPSGFAHGFVELAWACPIIWIVVAYFFRRLWDRATLWRDLRGLGYFMGYMIAVFYALTQEIITGQVNVIYVLLPLALVYTIAQVRRPRDLPALA